MMKRNTRHMSGFSLLELLLAMGVFFALLIALFILLQSFGQREVARANNKYMTTVADSMREILNNLDAYNALYQAAVANGGGYQLTADSNAPATDNIAKTFVLNGITIQGSRLLNAQFRDQTPLRGNVRILLRVADDMTNATDTPALEVLLVTSEPRPDELVRRAASESGPHGGFIETYGTKADARVVSAFGTWSVDPTQGLQNTAWYNGELNADLTSREDGSYYAYYMYKNIEEVGGDYLHRIRDVDPALRRNTMYGPLNIGGNDVWGGDDINIGNDGTARAFSSATPGVNPECDGNILCVNGTAVIKGSASIRDQMTTNGSALVADSARMNNLNLQNGLSDADKQAYGAQNHLVVDGNGNDGMGTQDLVEVGTNATFRDGATVREGNLTFTRNTTLTMPDGGVLTAGTIDSRRISATTVTSQTLTVDNQLRSGIVSNGDIDVVSGATGVIDITNSRDMIFGAPGRNRTINVPRVNVGTMNIENFGVCADGCAE